MVLHQRHGVSSIYVTKWFNKTHYIDVIMSAMASQTTGVSIICSTVCSGADQRKHQSSASLAFVRRLHRWPMDSHHKGPVMRKMFPFDDVIMEMLSAKRWSKLITMSWCDHTLCIKDLWDGNPPVTVSPRRAGKTVHLCFPWCSPEQAVEPTICLPMIWEFWNQDWF